MCYVHPSLNHIFHLNNIWWSKVNKTELIIPGIYFYMHKMYLEASVSLILLRSDRSNTCLQNIVIQYYQAVLMNMRPLVI